VLADGHDQADTAAPPGLRRDLQNLASQTDGVIAGDDARLFVTEDGVEIGRAQRDEGTGRVARRALERRCVSVR
jgi:hypothetical protein